MTQFDAERYGKHAAEAKYGILPASVVEPKVKAATVGGGAAGTVAAFVVWLLDNYLFDGPGEGVPPEVAALVVLAVTVAAAFVSGYAARHVNRLPLA